MTQSAATEIFVEPVAALDEKLRVAWLVVKGARVVAHSRPDPENRRTREQAERYLDALLDARLTVADGMAAAVG